MTKAEYIALGHAVREAVQIGQFINKLGLNKAIIESIALHRDNGMSIALTKNAKSQH